MSTVRFATIDDVPTVVALWGRAAGPTRRAGQAEETRLLLERDPQSLLVAEHDGRIIGTLIVGWDGWRCHMYRLAVDPEFRRTGVARQLTAEARRLAVSYGAVRVDAMVNHDNPGGEAFWKSAGFELDTEDRRWALVL